MLGKRSRLPEGLGTHVALEGPLLRVGPQVAD